MKSYIFLINIFVVLLIYYKPKSYSESRLIERVIQYHDGLVKGEYEATWDLIQEKERQKRRKDEWTMFLVESDAESRLVEFRIDSGSIIKPPRGVSASVKLKGRMKYDSLSKIENADSEDAWIYENGDWFRVFEH